MYPLLVLSVVALTVMLERGISIREATLDVEKLFADMEPLFKERRFAQAMERCQQDSGPVAGILAAGLANRKLAFSDIERAMEELARRETPILQQRLPNLWPCPWSVKHQRVVTDVTISQSGDAKASITSRVASGVGQLGRNGGGVTSLLL